MNTITQPKAAEMIRQSGGKLFSVEFIKRKDGSRRRMVARTGVRKGVTGEGPKFNPADHYLLTVHEFVTQPETTRDAASGQFIGGGNMATQFRSVPIDGIVRLRIAGTTYNVVPAPSGPCPF